MNLQFPCQMKGLLTPTQLLPSCQRAWTQRWADGHDSEWQRVGEEWTLPADESISKSWGFYPLPVLPPAPSPRLIRLAHFFSLPPKPLHCPFVTYFLLWATCDITFRWFYLIERIGDRVGLMEGDLPGALYTIQMATFHRLLCRC